MRTGHHDAHITRLYQQACSLDIWSPEALTEAFDIPGTYLWHTDPSFLFFRHLYDEIEIFAIGTRPDARRTGFASRLISNLQHYAISQRSSKIILEVSSSNEPARHFYNRHEFKQIGLRKKYYGRHTSFPGDALILCWER